MHFWNYYSSYKFQLIRSDEHCKYLFANVTLESLCLARSRLYISFFGLSKNSANGKEARQDDRV